MTAGIREYWNHTIGEQSVTWTNQIASKEEDADASTDSPVRYKRNAVLPPPPTRDEGESFDDYVARAGRDIRVIADPTVNSDEDLMYVLNGTGVYEAEISRGLDDIARMDELRGREMSAREIQQEIDIRAERERR